MSVKELQRLGKEFSKAEKDAKKELLVYYDQLVMDPELDEASRIKLHAEVRSQVAGLKEATTALKDTYQKTSAATDELETRLRDVEASRKKHRFIPAPPANAVIDRKERKLRHFAQGINFYKLFWVCFIGSFVGVVIEMLWCLITNGYIQSRSGLVYGPFNLLYGIGAVALTVALYRYRNRSSLISFLGGMLVGSAVEYVCSWAQELVFGSRSWDYSHMPFNLNGRICLLYSVFWGVLGVLWIKNIYPRMAKWILYIPNKLGRPLSWALVAFLVLNSVVTVAALGRWSQRNENLAPSNRVEEALDHRFPDERMARIFANMEFS